MITILSNPQRIEFWTIIRGPTRRFLIFCHVDREDPERAATVESHPCAKGRARMGHPANKRDLLRNRIVDMRLFYEGGGFLEDSLSCSSEDSCRNSLTAA